MSAPSLEPFAAEPPPLRRDAGGTIRVGNTRVTLDTVIAAYCGGQTVDDIAEAFDTLRLADIHAVIAYYLRHREAVDAYLERRDREADELRRKIEQRFPPDELRARLLAYRETAQS